MTEAGLIVPACGRDADGLAEDDPAGGGGLAEVEALRRRLLRLAFDVHDGPMQDLVAVSFRLSGLRSQVLETVGSAESERLSRAFDGLGGRLAGVERVLRSLMFSLEQGAASQGLLFGSVEAQVAAFRRDGSAGITVAVEGGVEPRTASQRIALERVLRESLSNIAKHAAAEHVEVRLRGTRDSILLQVRDDGRGFDPDVAGGVSVAVASGNRVGLRAMRERLRLIGGRLSIDSRPGGPTVISALLEKWQRSDSVPVSANGREERGRERRPGGRRRSAPRLRQ